jgi:hypothetical protein
VPSSTRVGRSCGCVQICSSRLNGPLLIIAAGHDADIERCCFKHCPEKAAFAADAVSYCAIPWHWLIWLGQLIPAKSRAHWLAGAEARVSKYSPTTLLPPKPQVACFNCSYC